jgi:hypothetical protein
MTALLWVLAGIGTLTLTSIAAIVFWAWLCNRAARRKRTVETFAALVDAIERHPAGSAMYAYRARPCGHLLHSRSLDFIELEHVELLHIASCEIARKLLPKNRKDAA